MTTLANPNSFDFLSHPPPPQAPNISPHSSIPTVRTTSRGGSNTITAISAWVAGVLPGSPPPASPPASANFSRRPSLFGPPRTARERSKSFISFADAADPNIPASTYTYTVVPLPIPPHISAPSHQPSFDSKRDYDSGPDDMKYSPLSAMRLHKTSTQVVAGSLSPAPPKKKGFMRFLHSRPRSRSTHARKALPLPPSSPTTIAFRIAHQKRSLYVQCGALPLPLDSEAAVMQFVGGGSRADAEARLGATYKDEAGAIYTDEAEARECLPLLLSVEHDGDDADLPDGLPSARSVTLEEFTFTSLPPSPLSQTNPPPPAPAQNPLTQAAASSPLALLSIPARGAGASVPRYLHTAPPSLPLPFEGLGSKAQLALPMEAVALRGKRRRRPPPLTLRLPAHTVGFEDSFSPCVVVEAPSPTTQDNDNDRT